MSKHLGERVRAGSSAHAVATVVVVVLVACALVFLAMRAPSGPQQTVVGDRAATTVTSTSEVPTTTTATTSAPPAPSPTRTRKPKPTTPQIKPSIAKLRALEKKMSAQGYTLMPRSTWSPYPMRISSFNILGASHTKGRGGRKGFASGQARLGAQIDYLNRAEITVAGMQEFQATQVRAFMGRTGGAWGIYPGTSLGDRVADNSIIWRTEVWEALETRTIDIPYFRGRGFPMPYVLLRNKTTGHRIWIGNFHNPANSRGNAAGYRAEAIRREARLAVELGSDGTPVFITGDMNDRAEFACPFTEQSGLVSADGARYGPSGCQLPSRMNVDWILGSPEIPFTEFNADFSTKDRNVSDHPMITATALLPGVPSRSECVPRLANRSTHWFCKL